MSPGNVYVTNGSLYKPKFRRIVGHRVRRTPVRVALKFAKQDPPRFANTSRPRSAGLFFGPAAPFAGSPAASCTRDVHSCEVPRYCGIIARTNVSRQAEACVPVSIHIALNHVSH